MSFSTDAKTEIINISAPKITCCRKAFAYGLLMKARLESDGRLTILSDTDALAAFSSEILGLQFGKTVETREIKRFGNTAFELSVLSKKAAELLLYIAESDAKIADAVGFKCERCTEAFLRGAFLSAGSISDPAKGYHAEFALHDARLAGKLYDLLTDNGYEPKIVNRKTTHGLYFKNSTKIEELLTHLGATHALFALMDSKIVHQIRNEENRATNCVARNISKSVSASQKQTLAIYQLIDRGALDTLPEELRVTARLRVENESVTLAELAALHSPPISKSGLNHRLGKIMDEAEKILAKEKK